jgi:hypothetical protein
MKNTVLFFILLSFIPVLESKVNMMALRMAVSDSVALSSPVVNNISVSSYSRVSVSTPTTGDLNKTDERTYFAPKSNRNPFISPVEYEQMRIIAEEKKKEEERKNQEIRGKIMDKKKREDPSRKYKLQGIVGKYAIINGEMIQEGKTYKKE